MSKQNKNIAATKPVGIFDSGIGGLTVASAVNELLPDETLIYFGDTAHLPYGDKSPASIQKWSVAISDFLMQFDCKMLIIACNSISSVAFHAVKKHIGKRAIVVNVIDPIWPAPCSWRDPPSFPGLVSGEAMARMGLRSCRAAS